MARRWRFVLALAAVATLPLGAGSFGIPTFRILSLLANQLSPAGTIHAGLRLPKAAVEGTLAGEPDGQDVTDLFAGIDATRTATLPNVTPGRHVLSAQIEARITFVGIRVPLRTTSGFETVDLVRPDECEVLNNAECCCHFHRRASWYLQTRPRVFALSCPRSASRS